MESEKQKIKKAWVALFTMFLGAIAPAATGLATYTTASTSIETELGRLRLEAEKTFASKQDFSELTRALNELAKEVSYLRGVLREKPMNGSGR